MNLLLARRRYYRFVRESVQKNKPTLKRWKCSAALHCARHENICDWSTSSTYHNRVQDLQAKYSNVQVHVQSVMHTVRLQLLTENFYVTNILDAVPYSKINLYQIHWLHNIKDLLSASSYHNDLWVTQDFQKVKP